MKAYKLTDENGKTQNDTQWGENISHAASGDGKELCSDGWIHFYTHPLIAVLMNPVHAGFSSPRMWECETDGEHLHESLKSGCKTLTTLKEIPVPEVSLTQRIAFGILCAKEVCKDKVWNEWADKWLSGEDRTEESARDAYDLVYNSTAAIAPHPPTAFTTAIIPTAVKSACTAAAAAAANNVHHRHSRAASYAARPAAGFFHNENKIDFIKIAEKAMTYK